MKKKIQVQGLMYCKTKTKTNCACTCIFPNKKITNIYFGMGSISLRLCQSQEGCGNCTTVNNVTPTIASIIIQ